MLREFFRQQLGLPPVYSETGAQVDSLIIYVHYLMVALFVGWGIFFIYTLIRFNRRAHPKADYVGVRTHASSWLEGIVAGIEAVLLIGFAVPMWMHNVDHYPDPKNALNLKVVAQQFNWNVFYPGSDGVFGKQDMKLISNDNPWGMDPADPSGKDDFAPLNNEIHVPVDKDVIIELTSKDVIHSFKVISMRVAQDAIPGLKIPLHFKATKVGVYQINCAQLCGSGHSGMAGGKLYVDTQADYDKWFAAKVKAAADAAAAAAPKAQADTAKPAGGGAS